MLFFVKWKLYFWAVLHYAETDARHIELFKNTFSRECRGGGSPLLTYRVSFHLLTLHKGKPNVSSFWAKFNIFQKVYTLPSFLTGQSCAAPVRLYRCKYRT